MAGNASQKGSRAFRSATPDLEWFDRLPPTARRALAGAAFDWSAGSIYSKWSRAVRGFKTGADAAARVAEWDALQLARDRKAKRGLEPTVKPLPYRVR